MRCVLLLSAPLFLFACKDDDPVSCASAIDCLQAGIPGTCLDSPASASRWCAFPDETCTSHSRWGVLAGDDLASSCVAEGGEVDAGVDGDAGGAADASACVPRIAFVSKRDVEVSTDADIYVMNLDGSGQMRLTMGGFNTDPEWSPDGREILYSCNFRICTISGKGGVPNPLLDDLTDSVEASASWSPDGKRIVFTLANLAGNESNVWSMSSDGSDQIQLTNTGKDNFPVWSPDGKKIAFSSTRDGNSELYVMNPDGTAEKNLSNHPGRDADEEAAWSPDGTQLLFVSDRDPNLDKDIYVIDAAGGPPVPLSSRGPNDVHPRWSPGGTRIVWSTPMGVSVMNADGSGQVDVTDSGGVEEKDAVWIGDSDVAFVAYEGQNQGAFDIRRAPAESSPVTTRLTSSLASDHSPAFTACSEP